LISLCLHSLHMLATASRAAARYCGLDCQYLSPTPLQTWMKEYCSSVDWRVICACVLGVKLLPCGVDVVIVMVLERVEVEPGVDMALYEVIHRNNPARCRRRLRHNIALRCHGSGSGARGGFTDICMLASSCVGWTCKGLYCW
jgi:hypothetical protein